MAQNLTTLICLYHSRHHAQIAMEKIVAAGIPENNITLVGAEGSEANVSQTTLAQLNVPQQDIQHLLDGITAGGAVLSVAALTDHIDTVEDIFHKYANKIDEADLNTAAPLAAATPLAAAPLANSGASQVTVPIVEEEMAVGKRTVDAGGVRVYRRVVEIPVEESVSLREEHINVDRRPVDRAVTDSDRLSQGDRVIELTETAEEAVVGKSARVVEEVVVQKQASDRVEHIQDTVRRTEVEIEEVEPDMARTPAEPKRTY